LRKALIISLLICHYGCSVQRYGKNKTSDSGDIYIIRTEAESKNVNRNDFIIEKGEIILRLNKERRKLIFSLKHNKPDTYLISVRNNVGIEGARIFINKDTLLVNDRINKKILYGKPEYLMKSYGIPPDLLNIVLGNVLNSSMFIEEKITDKQNSILINQNNPGVVIETNSDRKRKNIKECIYKTKKDEETFTITFSKYFNKEYNIPGVVDIINKTGSIYLKISIYKFVAPWNGKALFVPGAGYKEEKFK